MLLDNMIAQLGWITARERTMFAFLPAMILTYVFLHVVLVQRFVVTILAANNWHWVKRCHMTGQFAFRLSLKWAAIAFKHDSSWYVWSYVYVGWGVVCVLLDQSLCYEVLRVVNHQMMSNLVLMK